MKNREIVLTETVSIMIKLEDKIDIYTARAESELIQKICNVVEKADNMVSQITGATKNTTARATSTIRGIDKAKFVEEVEAGRISKNKNWKNELAAKYGFNPTVINNKYNYCKGAVKGKSNPNEKKTGRAENKWTDDETKYLVNGYNKGVSRDVMAEHLKKSVKQINDKIHYMINKNEMVKKK